ncbi:MAG: hypothetical protein GEV04_22165 [Actinophytocola sp.]|nr:hypothetical protein [Actinophytocola sp.]
MLLPSPTDQYQYYAPLGAVLAMYPTVASSIRQATQSLLAMCLGAALAVGAVAVSDPGRVLVASVVGVGVLIGVWRLVGEQAAWIPVSALFVLLIGGDQPVGYVVGYLGQVAIGLAIGVAVNLAILPPLHLGLSARRLDDLRETLADELEHFADLVAADRHRVSDEWASRERRLEPLMAEVRTAVAQADEARRANVRARWHRRSLDAQYWALRPLERVVILIQDLSWVLRDEPDGAGRVLALHEDLQQPVANCLSELAAVLRISGEPDRMRECLGRTEQLVTELAGQVESRTMRADYVSGAAVLLVDLRRAVDELAPLDESGPMPLEVSPT